MKNTVIAVGTNRVRDRMWPAVFRYQGLQDCQWRRE